MFVLVMQSYNSLTEAVDLDCEVFNDKETAVQFGREWIRNSEQALLSVNYGLTATEEEAIIKLVDEERIVLDNGDGCGWKVFTK